MTSSEKLWVEQAQYDLETAEAMLASGRFLYVVFCCQQAIEKALKAVVIHQTNEFPPRIHNLLRLAEVAEVDLDSDAVKFLGELSGYYIQTRYPEEIESIGRGITSEIAKEVILKSREVVEWLFSMLK